jgi:hypothetical protein
MSCISSFVARKAGPPAWAAQALSFWQEWNEHDRNQPWGDYALAFLTITHAC